MRSFRTYLTHSAIADHLSASEVRVLRNMISIEPLVRLDGEVTVSAIDDLIGSLGAEVAGRDAKHHLVVRLGQGSRLSEEIRRLTDGAIEADDLEGQLAFVRDDLSDSRFQWRSAPVLTFRDFGLSCKGTISPIASRSIETPAIRTSASWDFAQTASMHNCQAR